MPMDVQAFLRSVEEDPTYAGQIAYVHTDPRRQPNLALFPVGLRPEVSQFLNTLGISNLYRHQAEAVKAALNGEDVLITTGPASGKSLCYFIPILQYLLVSAQVTALLVFPTKPLARDQVDVWNRALAAVEAPRDLAAIPFDADTGATDRRAARDSVRVLVTNPEMLHVNLLPGHGKWGRFLRGLKFVVLDEVHTYAGFFGANMANVLRRLERVCEHYGSHPQFICHGWKP
jgi:DEAD/DEAH box helicase domain-containing protein